MLEQQTINRFPLKDICNAVMIVELVIFFNNVIDVLL